MKKFVLQNARVVTPRGILDVDVAVSDGKIVELKSNILPSASFEAIDLQGKYLLPGLIDVHVHFRTPGSLQKEDWVTGSKAALAGGVTTVLDMPNTDPATTNSTALELKRSLVQHDALVNYGFFAGATKNNLEDLGKMKGIAAIKVYMGSSTGNLLVDDVKTLEALMKANSQNDSRDASVSGKILALHAENEQCIQKGFHEHEGEIDPSVHSKIRGPECALKAVKLALDLVKKYRTRVHICHASTRVEIDLIRKFKKEEPDQIAKLVTVEVTPHHLFLSDKDYEQYGNIIKVNPPLRSQDDVKALWEAITDGTVDMIATDHAPHLLEEKMLPYPQVPSGVPGVQTMLPLLLNAVHEGRLTLEKVVELCSFHPALRFGMNGKGSITLGNDADFTVVDIDLNEKVCHKFLWTKTDWSPFHGWWLHGWPVMTFVNGELMYQWRDWFGENLGREIEFI